MYARALRMTQLKLHALDAQLALIAKHFTFSVKPASSSLLEPLGSPQVVQPPSNALGPPGTQRREAFRSASRTRLV